MTLAGLHSIPITSVLRQAIEEAQEFFMPFIQYRELNSSKVYTSPMDEVAEKIYLIACFTIQDSPRRSSGSLIALNYDRDISDHHIIPIPENISRENIAIINQATNSENKYSKEVVTEGMERLAIYLGGSDLDQERCIQEWRNILFHCLVRREKEIFPEEALKRYKMDTLTPVSCRDATPGLGWPSSAIRPIPQRPC